MAEFPALLLSDYLIHEGWNTPDTYRNHYASIPSESGVYLFLKVDLANLSDINESVLYVGMSTNLARRHSHHEIKQMLSDIYVQIWFKLIGQEKLRETERELITRFNPPYNIIGRTRGI